MELIQKIQNELKKQDQRRKILFIDGTDERAIAAAEQHLKDGMIEPILLLKTHDAVLEQKIPTLVISDFSAQMKQFTAQYVALRKGKETVAAAQKIVFKPHFFAMLLLKSRQVDGVIGGLLNPTSDILRAAFKVIGVAPGVQTISSVMIMVKNAEAAIFTDISVLPTPNAQQLVEIANNANQFAKQLALPTKTAFLSFSTAGSAQHPSATLVREATQQFNLINPDNQAVGEIQFDAAYDQAVRTKKYPYPSFTGRSNIFVFPSLAAGNIGYKIAQRMGGYGAIGPIITGIAQPVNDLSRGATTEDVYNTALITAIQSQ